MATIRRKKPESFAILSSPGPWPQVLINWLATLAVIIVFGLIMLFSASYTTGYLRMGDSFYYIKSQMLCLGLGLAVMLLFSRIDHRFLRRMVWPGYVVCIVMLIAVLFSAPLNGCRPLAAHRLYHSGIGDRKVRDDPAHGPSGRESAPSGKAGPRLRATRPGRPVALSAHRAGTHRPAAAPHPCGVSAHA